LLKNREREGQLVSELSTWEWRVKDESVCMIKEIGRVMHGMYWEQVQQKSQ